VEYNSVVFSPHTIKDIEGIERVQWSFTKNLPGLHNYSCKDRLVRLHLQSLEMLRLLPDLVRCNKVLFRTVDVQTGNQFEFNTQPSARIINHHSSIQTRTYKKHSTLHVRTTFFCERVVNIWNSLPADVDFSTVSRFRRSIQRVDFSKFYNCF